MATAASRIADQGFQELEFVRLRSAIYDEGVTLPVGTQGTVVIRYDADAYVVEFQEPVGTLVTLRRSDLELA